MFFCPTCVFVHTRVWKPLDSDTSLTVWPPHICIWKRTAQHGQKEQNKSTADTFGVAVSKLKDRRGDELNFTKTCVKTVVDDRRILSTVKKNNFFMSTSLVNIKPKLNVLFFYLNNLL